jgi:hypothetical protein
MLTCTHRQACMHGQGDADQKSQSHPGWLAAAEILLEPANTLKETEGCTANPIPPS